MTVEDDPPDTLQVPRLTPSAQRIVEVASGLFYRQGIHAVGVDTIAAESGVTKRTLYDRFGSKGQLVAVYLQLRHQDWWARMEHQLEREADVPVLTLFDSYTADTETTYRGCAFINAAAELPADHPAFQVVRAHKHAVFDRLVDLLRAGPAADHGDDVSLAQEIYLVLEGAIAHRGIDSDGQLLTRAREVIARLIAGRNPDTAPSADRGASAQY